MTHYSKNWTHEMECKSRSEWRARHRESERERSQIWRVKNPEESVKTTQRWRAKNPNKATEIGNRASRKRRASKRGLSSEYYTVDEIYYRDNGICGICHKLLFLEDVEIDHIVPISRGGPDVKANVQVAHVKCNRKKGVKSGK